MTLLFGSTIGFLCGFLLGRRRAAYVIVALTWYACLAIQTAHLAHEGTDGFFGIDGLSAVQGKWFAQYWLGQIPIAALIIAMFIGGDALRRRHRAAAARSPS